MVNWAATGTGLVAVLGSNVPGINGYVPRFLQFLGPLKERFPVPIGVPVDWASNVNPHQGLIP
jgi:hypothetical protein